MSDPIQQFREAMIFRGIVPPAELIGDGRIHRCDAAGPNGNGDASYLLHFDGIAAGGFQNWRDGQGWQKWREDGREFTKAEEELYQHQKEAAREKWELEKTVRTREARERAALQLENARPAANHPYLIRKGVESHGACRDGQNLLIPVRDANDELHSLQVITPTGAKRFLTGGKVDGCFFLIGQHKEVVCVAEGFATGASIHEATGYAVAIAFSVGNLKLVAEALREKYRELQLILCADDDYRTDGNPGMTKAEEVAVAVGGLLASPDFGQNRPDGAKDFNDLHQAQGLGAVRAAILNATKPEEICPPCDRPKGFEWPEPQDLSIKLHSEPYPIYSLPMTVRAAVEEIQGFTKAPAALVASSALAALSLAIQSYYDVKRADKLTGPVSLFLLTIADSGERKSTSDNFFTQAIRDFEASETEMAKPKVREYKSAMEIWEAKHGGVKEKIRASAKDNKPTLSLETSIRDLECAKPEPPRVPRVFYADVTPEALAYGLAKVWPSAGVVTAEAGVVFGSHGMSKDSVVRNLAQLNVLWDGGSLPVDRRTGESFTARGVRLTTALQVQEATLRSFMDRTNGLARGIGFLARFLIAWPESTQGFRPFTEAPARWVALEAFNQRMAAILERPVPLDENGALTPTLLPFTQQAKTEWVAFHDRIEKQLASGGALYEVRDVASKIADNAARLAALFHVFEGGDGPISRDAFLSAASVIEWHLNEARRFFGELALPTELADAVRLDKWLCDHCRGHGSNMVARRDIQRNVTPVHLRQKAALEEALRELVEAGRIVLRSEGRHKVIHVNPQLLDEI